MLMLSSDSTIPKIDLRLVRDALILRWWIVPLAMLLSVGFLFANESNLQTTPAYVRLGRLYEARDESAVLSVAGIDPASIVPFPSFENQLLVLQTPETRQKIADTINADTAVTVTRSEQKFSLVDTIEGEGKTRFTFLSVGTPSYSFGCVASTANECTIAVDAYVAEISRLRAQSIQQGFERAEAIMNALASNSQNENSSLLIKQQALDVGKTLVSGELALISSTTDDVGPSVSTGNASTYVFGLGLGALLGLLVVLQLTVTDRRIRTVRKLAVSIGEENILGTLRPSRQDSGTPQVAAGLIYQLARHGATSARLIPIDGGDIDSIAATLDQALLGHPIEISVLKEVKHLSATDLLSPPGSMVVFVIDADTSRTDVLKKAWMIIEHAGNTIAGVILVQH